MLLIGSLIVIESYLVTISAIGLMSRAFPNGLGDRGSILVLVIQKTKKKKKKKKKKMVLDITLLNTEHYEVRIKGKVLQFRVSSSALPYTSV